MSAKSTNATALDRWAKLRQAAEAEEELKEWITQTYGRSKYLELLKIRREVLAEKREAEAQARRDAIQRQEMMITIVGIVVLLVFSAVGAAAYLHYMGWIDIRVTLDDLCTGLYSVSKYRQSKVLPNSNLP